MSSTNLRRHCYAVSHALGGIYDYLEREGKLESSPSTGSGQISKREIWEVLGILHDADYELTKDPSTSSGQVHTLLTLRWLEEEGLSKEDLLYKAIESHNNKVTKLREPQTQMEWALECCDELTGFIVAVALVKDKKLSNVDVPSILKKWNQKAFAGGVDRKQIEQCSEKLSIPLETFVGIVLKAMQENSRELGLQS